MSTFAHMKANRNKWRVALAIILLMVLTLVPHHHHEGGAACWVAQVCHQDGKVNDAHTPHHHDTHTHWCYWHKATTNTPTQGIDAGFLPFSFWQSQSTYIAYATQLQHKFAPVASHYVCSHGKHIRRRGPPVI